MPGTALYQTCDFCKRHEDPDKGIFVSSFSGYAGYGSMFDGEFISIHICTECLDKAVAKRLMQESKQGAS